MTGEATVGALPPGSIAGLLAATMATIDAEMAGLGPDGNHVRQLLAVTQARVWEQMGATRRFSLEEG